MKGTGQLSRQLLIWMLWMSFGLSLVTALLNGWMAYRAESARQHEQVEVALRAYGQSFARALFEVDDEAVSLQMAALRSFPAILSAQIVVDGSPRFTYSKRLANQQQHSPVLSSPLKAPDGGKIIGNLQIRLDAEALRDQVLRDSLFFSLLVSSELFLLAAALFWRVKRSVSEPIQSLSRHVQDLTIERLQTPAPRPASNAHNELHQLSDGFTQLQYELQAQLKYRDDTTLQLAQQRDQLNLLNVDLERRVAERTEELSRTMLEQQAILDNAQTGILIIRNRRILRCNRGLEQMGGYDEGELLGKPASIFYASKEAFHAFIRAAQPLIVAGKTFAGDLQHIRKQGDTIWSSVYGKALDPHDLSLGTVWVMQDITARKQTETQLLERSLALEVSLDQLRKNEVELLSARHAAEAASRQKSDFLAAMSHEIRTPMSAIIGMAHLALRTRLDAKQYDYVEKIHHAGLSLLGIINDILDFSKIEAGRLEIEHAPFLLDEVLSHLQTLIAQKATEKGLHFTVDIPEDLPRHLIGDPLRLGQVLLNLVNNAVKFTEQGQVHLSGRVLSRDAHGARLRFDVKDTGIGMTREQLGRLFAAFTQADGSTSRKYGGTGLGLSISRRLVNMMGGEIGVDSVHGAGSNFFFELPFVLADPSMSIRTAVTASQMVHDYQGTRVLLVEDNEINQQIAIELLDTIGIQVEVACGGREAIDALLRHGPGEFQLILMDLEMPVMDGHAATLAIRQDRRFDSTPIIAMTAHAMAEVRQRCLDEGMQDYVSKPIQPDLLFDVVGRWLGNQLKVSASPAMVTGKPAATTQQGEIPFALLTEIDTDLGMRYMGSKTSLYARLLTRFCASQAETADRLALLIDQGEYGEAERVVHTLKGLAGSMGATRVQARAEALETALQAGKYEAAMLQDTLLPALNEALAAVLQQLNTHLSVQGEMHDDGPTLAREEVQAIIVELGKLLTISSGETPLYFESQEAALRQHYDIGTMARLRKHISNFEFDDAIEILRR